METPALISLIGALINTIGLAIVLALSFKAGKFIGAVTEQITQMTESLKRVENRQATLITDHKLFSLRVITKEDCVDMRNNCAAKYPSHLSKGGL